MVAASGLTQPLSQRPHVAYALPHPLPQGDRLGGVPPVLIVAVTGPLGSAGSRSTPMHSAATSSRHDRRLAWRSRACPSATASRLAQLFWLRGRVHGVASHAGPR